MIISPDEDDVISALESFLVSVLPAGTPVIQTQGNRAPEPVQVDFVLMTPGRMARMGTNIDLPADVAFTASVAGTVMTVSAVLLGTILINSVLFGSGVAAGTSIVSQASGPAGGAGVYGLSSSQGTLTSRTMASGAEMTTQKSEFTVQLDVHGPASADSAQLVSTLLRDSYATTFFAAMNVQVASPLYSEDPRQAPFVNEQNQYENRWVVEVKLQVDQTVRVPQQFADSVSVVLRSVDADFPPS